MIALLMLSVVVAQQSILDSEQYNALMDVYEGMGARILLVPCCPLTFFIFFSHPGCSTLSCPRFANGSSCDPNKNNPSNTTSITCINGKVTRLWVGPPQVPVSFDSDQRFHFFRILPNKSLNGTLPETIGQLTALNYLYFFIDDFFFSTSFAVPDIWLKMICMDFCHLH